MVANRCPQILQLATGCRLRSTLPDVIVAGLPVDMGQRCIAEEVQNPPEPGSRLLRASMLVGDVLGVDADYVGDFDVIRSSASNGFISGHAHLSSPRRRPLRVYSINWPTMPLPHIASPRFRRETGCPST